MIENLVTSLPLSNTSPYTAKNSAVTSSSPDAIQVYLLSEKCIYSGGGRNGQSVHVFYTEDSTPEDPIVQIFGTSTSGDYKEVIHLNDIDPTNATYAELCALLAHQNRIGAYTPGGNKLLRPTPLQMDSVDYSKRMDYVSLIRDQLQRSDFVDVTNSTQELLDFWEQYLAESAETSKEFVLPDQIDLLGRFRIENVLT